MELSKQAMVRAAYRVSLSSGSEIAGRAVNLILPYVLLGLYEVNVFTDNFFFALSIAFFFHGTLANVLVNALVPVTVDELKIRNLRIFFAWALSAGMLAGLLNALLASNALSFFNTVITTLAIFAMATAGLLAAPAIAALNADHRYMVPGITWGLRIFPLLYIIIGTPPAQKLPLLLVGLALADIARTAILFLYSRNKFTLAKFSESLRMPPAAFHLVLASSVAGLTPIFVRWIASTGPTGAVSIFEAADRLYTGIASLSTIGLGNVILVYLARLTGTAEEKRSWEIILRGLSLWSLLCFGFCILLWVFFPFITALIKIQNFQVLEDIRATFLALGLGMPGFIMTTIFSRRLLVVGRSSSLLAMAIAGLIWNVFLSPILFFCLGTTGIALSLSGSHYLVAFLMFMKLKRV